MADDDLIARVVAARKKAEAENAAEPHAPRSEAQHAAILIAQVQAIMYFDPDDPEPEGVEAKPDDGTVAGDPNAETTT